MEFDDAIKIALATEKWSLIHRLDTDWMLAMYTVETHFEANNTDGKGSYGIPQLQVKTAQEVIDNMGHRFTITPDVLQTCNGLAIRLSCRNFRDLLNEFDGDYIKATRAYNAGATNVKRGYFKVGHPCLPGMNYFELVLKQYEVISGIH